LRWRAKAPEIELDLGRPLCGRRRRNRFAMLSADREHREPVKGKGRD
jgi:hypothetical protein